MDFGILGCGNGGLREEEAGRLREGFCWWRNTILGGERHVVWWSLGFNVEGLGDESIEK